MVTIDRLHPRPLPRFTADEWSGFDEWVQPSSNKP
jgi:hypothetical protein